jgi:hypothetical protein
VVLRGFAGCKLLGGVDVLTLAKHSGYKRTVFDLQNVVETKGRTLEEIENMLLPSL